MNKMNIYNEYLHLLTKYSMFTPKCGLYTHQIVIVQLCDHNLNIDLTSFVYVEF